jgi:flagella basal body P-ring formation protein FlgA
MKVAVALFLASLPLLSQESGALAPVERLQQAAIEFAQAQAKGSEGHYLIQVTKPPVLPKTRGSDLRFEPSHLSKREPTGAFFAVFRVMDEGRLAGSARVELEGRWTGKLLKATESMGRKTVPAETQLEEVAFEGNPPPGALSQFPEGFRLRSNVSAGHTLTQADLEPIPLVSAGERVRLTVRSGCLAITADGTARSPGAMGDKVRVELPSRKWVQAVVTGPNEARVDWGG